MRYITLTPAYGRDYKSKKAVQDDWDANKDFIIQCIGHPYDGRYMNKSDAQPGETYSIRYDKLRKIHPVAGK